MTAPPSAKAPFDPCLPLRLHPSVALRDESFGALAYHFDTRRLVFLKSRALVDVVVDLEHHACARDAVAAHVEVADVERYVSALGRLYHSGLLDGR